MEPDGDWLQWVEEKSIPIKPWYIVFMEYYGILARLVYRKPLNRQQT
jgi:hypothetical protein